MKTLLHATLIFMLVFLASCSSKKAPTMTEQERQEAAQSVASIAVLSTTAY